MSLKKSARVDLTPHSRVKPTRTAGAAHRRRRHRRHHRPTPWSTFFATTIRSNCARNSPRWTERTTGGEIIASMDFVFGDVSLVFTNPGGTMRQWSLNVPPGGEQRVFVRPRNLTRCPGGADFFAASQRNKSFLTGSGAHATSAACDDGRHPLAGDAADFARRRWRSTENSSTRVSGCDGHVASL